MKLILLYKMQDYYLVVRKNENSLPQKNDKKERLMLHKNEVNNDIKKILPSIFEHVFPDLNQDVNAYRIINHKNHILIIGLSHIKNLFFSMYRSYYLEKLKTMIAIFRLETRERLISSITDKHCSLHISICAFTDYIQYDEYSLWIFNNETKYFTFVSGTKTPEIDHIVEEKAKGLYSTLDPNYITECRAPNDCELAPFLKMGMKTLTRSSFTLGPHSQPAVLTFYSKNSNFTIQPSMLESLISQIKLKYNNQLRSSARGLEEITRTLFEKSTSTLEEYMCTVVKLLCDKLQYEAASALLLNEVTDNLDLIATHDFLQSGIPSKKVSYKKNKKCLTNLVRANPKSLTLIYDLEKNKSNSHRYDEITENKGKNWIGIPIKYKDKVIAVIRLKNKFILDEDTKSIIAPRPSDYYNIMAIASTMEGQINNRFTTQKLRKKLEKHNNLSKVYKHEIRGPVSSIVTIPGNLIEELKRSGVDQTSVKSIIQGLQDLEDLAGNLQFISEIYDIEKLISNQDNHVKSIPVLADLVMPILKLTKRYYQKKYDSNLIVNHESMKLIRIFGKKELYMMVLYALLDNAGKYQENEEGDIHVFCKNCIDSNFINLYVANYGLEILDSERMSIFENDGRGSKAIESRIDGSGIGLWLCSQIMKKYGGNIELESNYNPVRFKLTFPRDIK